MSAPAPQPLMTLAAFNAADEPDVHTLLGACLDVPDWVDALATGRPYADRGALQAAAADHAALVTWEQTAAALARHPRIGERPSGSGTDARWSSGEQAGVRAGEIDDLAAGNAAYEARFGHIFLICAAGLSGEQMLNALRDRMDHSDEQEHDVVIGELGKIALLRLDKAVGA